MRVLMFNYEYPPLGGGAGNATKCILNEFAQRPDDISIHLITSSTEHGRTEEHSSNITIEFLDIGKRGDLHYQTIWDLLRYSWKSLKYARSLLETENFDLAHAFFGIPCGYLAMKLNLPYIVSLRGSDVPFYNPRFRLLDRFLFQRMSRRIWRKAGAVVANSNGLRDLALRTSPHQEISVIFNGVDTGFYAPPETPVANKMLTLVSTGRLIARKGYQYLIPALAGLEQVRLVLVGGGKYREELEAMASLHSVEVEFAGIQSKEEVRHRLQASDVFVLPSTNEGMSNSLLEALAVGLPVIVTDVGGSSELVIDNGTIIPRGDTAALRNAVCSYLEDPELIRKHGRRSRETACRMTWQKVAESYIRVYRKLSRRASDEP